MPSVPNPDGEGRTLRRYKRPHTAKRSVKAMDLIARGVITIGGLGTIVAVLLVGIYLFTVVLPLFAPAKAGTPVVSVQVSSASAPAIMASQDEYGRLRVILRSDGSLTATTIKGGVLMQQAPWAKKPSAFSLESGDPVLVAGLQDGSVRLGEVKITSRPVTDETNSLAPDTMEIREGGRLFWSNPLGTLVSFRVKSLWNEPAQLGLGNITCVSHQADESSCRVLAGDVTGQLAFAELSLTDGSVQGNVQKVSLSGPVVQVSLLEGGTIGLAALADGSLVRFDCRSFSNAPKEMERIPAGDRPLAVAAMRLPGRDSLALLDAGGGISIWSSASLDARDEALLNRLFGPDGRRRLPADNKTMVRAHQIQTGLKPVATAVAPYSRLLAVAGADGRIAIYNTTTAKEIAHTSIPGAAIEALSVSPKEDGLVIANAQGIWGLPLHVGHHDVSLGTLITAVHYESYPEPAHIWQTTKSSVTSEQKLGLFPLIFGTLKATLYALIIGVPIALVAALYTSEFMTPSSKTLIKPAIETMASLPSVVLGFIGGLWIAQQVAEGLMAVILCLYLMPFSLMFGAHLWQFLPFQHQLKWKSWRLVAVGLSMVAGVGISILLAPLIEHLFFTVTTMNAQGVVVRTTASVTDWLNAGSSATQQTSPIGGWFFALLPVSAILIGLFSVMVVKPWTRRVCAPWDGTKIAGFSMGVFLTLTAATVILAYLLAVIFPQIVGDARGLVVGRFDQRNALVVGFVMGFAIIPLIYTISEDALSAVPNSLRAASLGSGATPWQTAVLVVLPVATSGVFSAIMIGLGRAVGETMIILMATGNTPVMTVNPFEGFRTLSASIAQELSDAIQGSSHYRVLFLAALILFSMTFVLNTCAEVVRARFRKKTMQL